MESAFLRRVCRSSGVADSSTCTNSELQEIVVGKVTGNCVWKSYKKLCLEELQEIVFGRVTGNGVCKREKESILWIESASLSLVCLT